jgi:uncharacterized protein (TIGR02145 family)
MREILNLIPLVCLLTGFATLDSCKKEEDSTVPIVEPPGGVITNPVTAIASYEAIAGGSVYYSGGSEKMFRFVCWNTKPDPDTSSLPWLRYITNANDNPGSFTTNIGKLLPNTTYYVRAFAFNEAGITYGNQVYFTTNPDVSDIEGNTYGTTNIGTQVWMTENLRTTKYNDGEPIPLVTKLSDWRTLSGPGYYPVYFIDPFWQDTSIVATLYNWHSVNTGKLCPVGWHVPTDAEWLLLPLYIGPDILCSNEEWNNWEQTYANAYLFHAKNTVIRDTLTGTIGLQIGGNQTLTPQWWSATSSGSHTAWYFILDPEMMRQKYSKKYGLAVRCVKD